MPIGSALQIGYLAGRQNVSFRASVHTGVGISIEFRASYRHPFVGDGFPVLRNSETCMGRDGKPVPYDAFTVGPTNSQFNTLALPCQCVNQ